MDRLSTALQKISEYRKNSRWNRTAVSLLASDHVRRGQESMVEENPHCRSAAKLALATALWKKRLDRGGLGHARESSTRSQAVSAAAAATDSLFYRTKNISSIEVQHSSTLKSEGRIKRAQEDIHEAAFINSTPQMLILLIVSSPMSCDPKLQALDPLGK